MTVYAYSRVSSDKQTTGTSLELQQDQEILNKVALKFNTNVADRLYVDEGISAYSGDNLKHSLGDLISDIEGNVIKSGDVIVMRALDRLTRLNIHNASDVVNKIFGHKIHIYTTSDNQHYKPEDIMSLVSAVMAFNTSHQDSRKKAYFTYQNAKKRISEFYQRKNESCPVKHIGAGSLPFYLVTLDGYIQKHPKLFNAMKEVVQSYISGQSLGKCIKLLDERYGHKISKVGLSQALSSKKLLGTFELTLVVNDDILSTKNEKESYSLEGYSPALCTEKEFNLIQIQKQKRYKSNGRKKHANLVSGLRVLTCNCGSPMYIHSKGYYKCNDDCLLIPEYTLDKLTMRTMTAFWLMKKNDFDESEIQSLEYEIKELEEELKATKEFYRRNFKSYGQSEIEKDLGQLESRISEKSVKLEALIKNKQEYLSGLSIEKSVLNTAHGEAQIAEFFKLLCNQIDDYSQPLTDRDAINEARKSIPQYLKNITLHIDGLVVFTRFDGSKIYYYLPMTKIDKVRGLRNAVKLIIAPNEEFKKEAIDFNEYERFRMFTEGEIERGEYKKPYISLNSTNELPEGFKLLASPPKTQYRAIDAHRARVTAYLNINPHLVWVKANGGLVGYTESIWQKHKAIEYYKNITNISRVHYATNKGFETYTNVFHHNKLNKTKLKYDLPHGCKKIIRIESVSLLQKT